MPHHSSSNFEAERERQRATGAEPKLIQLRTRVPSKWRFVDLETGDIWAVDTDGYFYPVKGSYSE